MEDDRKATRFQTFVAMRRRWFLLLLPITFLAMLELAGKRSDSTVEIIGVAAVGAVVSTSLVSLASIPVIWSMSRKRRGMES